MYFTIKMSVVRPFRSLVRTRLALSKTGRFLSKAEILGVGGLFPPFKNWREMPTILDVNFGREFFGWPETLEKQGRKFRYQNSPSNFAERFAGNFPKIRRAKIKNSPQIRSAYRRGQQILTHTYSATQASIYRSLQALRARNPQKSPVFFGGLQ